MGWKKHMASVFVNLVTSYVRLTKAVGWVYSFVSHEYIMSIVRRSSSDIRSNGLKSTTFSTHPQSPDQLYFSSKSRANRLPACRIDRRGNNLCQFDGIGFTNRFPVSRIANTKDESTLVGCIGQPSGFQTWSSVSSNVRAPCLHPACLLPMTWC